MNNLKNIGVSFLSLFFLRVFFGAFSVLGLSFNKFSALFVLLTFLATTYLKLRLEFIIPVLSFLALLTSEYFNSSFIFFSKLNIGTEVFWLGILSFLFFHVQKKQKSYFLILMLLQTLLAVSFINQADGMLLFSDDHPSFLYRLILLKEHFPKIPFYDVSWNAGYSAREFFASGMLNIFFASLPFVYLFDFSSFDNAYLYNYIIIWGYVYLVPWAVYYAARLTRLDIRAAFFASVLALGPSTGYFEWLLKYGTLGFCFSAGLLPLAFILAYKVAFEEVSWKDILLLLLISFGVLSWSLSFLAFLPIVIIGLFKLKEVLAKEKRIKLVVFISLFFLINIPWIITFINESKVTSFVSSTALPGAAEVSKSFDFKLALSSFRSLSQKVNPLLILMFLPGLCYIGSSRRKVAFLGSILLLLLIALIGEQFKPQLELKRLIIPASFLMCLLSGAAISAALNYFSEELITKNYINKIVSAGSFVLISGFFCLSPLNVAAVYSNKTDEHFKFADSNVKDLVEGIKKHADDNRVFFAGFVLQELGSSSYYAQDGGHIAPLTAFTGKAMYASHYYHKHWTIVDPIPTAYRKRGEQGIEEFLDLINASSVVTHSHEWAKYCASKPYYTQIFQAGRFRFFKRQSAHLSYFLKGAGQIKNIKDGILLKPETEEVVIKYRFLPKLKTFGGGEIFPEPVFIEELGGAKTEDVNYVRLKFSSIELAKKDWIKIAYYE